MLVQRDFLRVFFLCAFLAFRFITLLYSGKNSPAYVVEKTSDPEYSQEWHSSYLIIIYLTTKQRQNYIPRNVEFL